MKLCFFIVTLAAASKKQNCGRPGDDIYNPTLFDSVPAACCNGQKPGVAHTKLVCPCNPVRKGVSYVMKNAGSGLFLKESPDGTIGLSPLANAEGTHWTFTTHEPGFTIENVATQHHLSEDSSPMGSIEHRLVAASSQELGKCQGAHCYRPMGSLWFLGYITEPDVPVTAPGVPCENQEFSLVNFLGSSLYELQNGTTKAEEVTALTREFEMSYVPIELPELRWIFVPVNKSDLGFDAPQANLREARWHWRQDPFRAAASFLLAACSAFLVAMLTIWAVRYNRRVRQPSLLG